MRERYQDDKQLLDAYCAWDATGPETRAALLGLLPDGWSFEGKRVLDFGCGTGRTLRHFLAEAQTGEFWGADLEPRAVRQVQETCPPVHAAMCGVEPPLGLEYQSFDLAWAISVFTHLSENSLPWLLELHRLLKPGGLLIATYIGRWNSEYVAGEAWDENRVGMNVLQHTQGWDRGGPTVLISDWWVHAHWGRAFEIVSIAPQIHNMSWVLMRKRDLELTVEDLQRPADDPREYQAVQHNLEQVRRELELTQAVCEKLLADLRSEYETSRSWQITRPIRDAAQIVRSKRSLS